MIKTTHPEIDSSGDGFPFTTAFIKGLASGAWLGDVVEKVQEDYYKTTKQIVSTQHYTSPRAKIKFLKKK